jgi:hypothetical protein
MSGHTIIPQQASKQVFISGVPGGGIRLAVYLVSAFSAIVLSPADALAIADDLRFRALAMMKEGE